MEMESSSIPIMKRVWSLVRVAFFMLRKGISKGKLMMDLNMMLKRRRKIAGKVISNLMFHHHHDGSADFQFSGQREYEFSCSNTPNNFFFFPIGSSKRHRQTHRNTHNHAHFFACAHAPPTQDDEVVVKAVLEMLNNEVMVETSSPALPGFGQSPMMVRQLRVTDSPFPLLDADDDHQVDMAAEAFIKKFYKELKTQS